MNFLFALFVLLIVFDAQAQDDQDACAQPKVVGRCEAINPKYFFNKETKACEKFNYGGCGGNANNFVTYEECAAACL